MGRLILGVVATPLIWGMLSVPINLGIAAVSGQIEPPYTTGYLLLILVLSFGYSLIAGYCAAWIAASNELKLSLGAGVALLLVGLLFQSSAWDTIPLWYHLIFLVMLIPMCMLGARLRKSPDGPSP